MDMNTETTLAFIRRHRESDIRQIALEGHNNPAVDLPFALVQIQGWQTARGKLPTWAARDDILYPPHLNMEQCSSEHTALYKRAVVGRLLPELADTGTLVDLTGGYGVDFFCLSRGFARAVYVERDPRLCELARHNMAVLGRPHAEIHCDDAPHFLQTLPATGPSSRPTVIFLDPARRGSHGEKVFGLSDCEPDVTLLRDDLLARCDMLLLKLSPMLDWHEALRRLRASGAGCEVHIVATGNECKELLMVITRDESPLRVYCVNDDERFVYTPAAFDPSRLPVTAAPVADALAGWLHVPNAAIMKAGCFDELAAEYSLSAVGPNSHLFVAHEPVERFPGRRFRIVSVCSLNKRDVRQALSGVTQANIATRNFPLSVPELRKRLKIKDGGNLYIFATTWQEKHVLILCER